MCLYQDVQFAECGHYRAVPTVIHICSVARDKNLYQPSGPNANYRTVNRVEPQRVNPGCCDIKVKAGVMRVDDYCFPCTYQRRENIQGGMSRRFTKADGTDVVTSLTVLSLNEKPLVFSNQPLRIRFADMGDLEEDGKSLEVDLTMSDDDDGTLELAYNDYLRTGDLQKCGLGRHSLGRDLAGKPYQLEVSRHLQERQERQEQEYRQSNISRGFDIRSTAAKVEQRGRAEAVVENSLETSTNNATESRKNSNGSDWEMVDRRSDDSNHDSYIV
jgi:hypothetical protein